MGGALAWHAGNVDKKVGCQILSRIDNIPRVLFTVNGVVRERTDSMSCDAFNLFSEPA